MGGISGFLEEFELGELPEGFVGGVEKGDSFGEEFVSDFVGCGEIFSFAGGVSLADF